jgi:hypothetical protein
MRQQLRAKHDLVLEGDLANLDAFDAVILDDSGTQPEEPTEGESRRSPLRCSSSKLRRTRRHRTEAVSANSNDSSA